MRTTLGLISLALTVSLGIAGPAQADDDLITWPRPEQDVAGVNDWSCRATARRPRPVVLVHGTFGDKRHLLEKLAKTLLRKGYCVYALNYGNRATGPVQDSAKQLRRFTNRVLRSTGAAKVSMIGHSQGGLMPRYYIKFLGGRRVVDDLIGLAPSNHGTRISGGSDALSGAFHENLFGTLCRSCGQQRYNSPFLQRLNRWDETPGPVSYTQITTRLDTVVVPHASGYLEPGPRTTNLTIQELCPTDLAEHIRIPMSDTAIAIALNALRRDDRPARRTFDPCP